MNISFKPASFKDVETIGGIFNYYIQYTTSCLHLLPLNEYELVDSFLTNDERFKTFTIYFEKSICGYVQIMPHKKRDAYNCSGEISIYLDKEFTNRGIGKLALDFIETYAKANDFHSLLATICSENIHSIDLFMQNGYSQCALFKEVGRKFDRYLDVIVLQKIIQ